MAVNGISADSVMALRSAILQRNAALRDAASVGSTGAAGGATGGVAETGATPGTDFTAALKSALDTVNGLQNDANSAAVSFEKGETTDIASVMLAKQKASMGFEATLQVRNKLLSAYKDIMSMPV